MDTATNQEDTMTYNEGTASYGTAGSVTRTAYNRNLRQRAAWKATAERELAKDLATSKGNR